MPDALLREVEALIERTREIWDTQRYIDLKEVWDTEDAEPFYVPEEDEPKLSWDALEGYWDPMPGDNPLEGIRNVYSNVRVKRLASDLCVALYDLRYELKVKGLPHAFAGTDRVMAVLRNRGQGWKYVAYIEAPFVATVAVRLMVDALPEEEQDRWDPMLGSLRQLVERSVPPDFADYLKRHGTGS